MTNSRKKTGYYAVAIGRQPGIYVNWDECHEQVDGFPHNRYKWFHTIEEAQCFVGGVGVERAAAYWPRDRYEAVPRSITYGHGSAM